MCGLTGDLRALRPRVRDIIVDPTHSDPTDNMLHAGSRRTVERELLSHVGVHPAAHHASTLVVATSRSDCLHATSFPNSVTFHSFCAVERCAS